jgi:hypothetical protein
MCFRACSQRLGVNLVARVVYSLCTVRDNSGWTALSTSVEKIVDNGR